MYIVTTHSTFSCLTALSASPWIWKGVSATLQSGRYTLSYSRGRLDYGSLLLHHAIMYVQLLTLAVLNQCCSIHFFQLQAGIASAIHSFKWKKITLGYTRKIERQEIRLLVFQTFFKRPFDQSWIASFWRKDTANIFGSLSERLDVPVSDVCYLNISYLRASWPALYFTLQISCFTLHTLNFGPHTSIFIVQKVR